MIVEAVIIISLVLGGVLGYGASERVNLNKTTAKEPEPRIFQEKSALSHRQLMIQCQSTCGEAGVRKYSILLGICECSTRRD